MDASARIEMALTRAIDAASTDDGPTRVPPSLLAAVRYAVFPGGARIRPRLTLAVARACGSDGSLLVDAAAAAVELMHCASLIHDDLPCFDDANLRRGRPTVHRAFDERLAVLAGDALIVLAFDTLAREGAAHPIVLARLVPVIVRGVGLPVGIVAGQACECEPCTSLETYHRAKTGALFAAATAAGAAAAGRDPAAWYDLGDRLGEAYQVADDLRDAVGDVETLGKPVGRDQALGRPSAVQELGVQGAVERVRLLVAEAIESIPVCPGAAELRAHVMREATRLVPRQVSRPAA
jgi:geranylgeranyl diphosphate synthase type II